MKAHVAHTNASPLSKEAELAFRRHFAASRCIQDAVIAITLLLLGIPLHSIIALQDAHCACSPTAIPPTHVWSRQMPLLKSFPCSGCSTLAQAHWYLHRWWPATVAVHWGAGDWQGAYGQLGAAVVASCMLLGARGWYLRHRSSIVIVWRVGTFLAGLAALAWDIWLEEGGLPLAGIYFGRKTLWGSTSLLWHSIMFAVPFKLHCFVQPIEFATVAAASMLYHRHHLTPHTVLKLLSMQLILGVLLPSTLIYYLEQQKRCSFWTRTPRPPTKPQPLPPTTLQHAPPSTSNTRPPQTASSAAGPAPAPQGARPQQRASAPAVQPAVASAEGVSPQEHTSTTAAQDSAMQVPVRQRPLRVPYSSRNTTRTLTVKIQRPSQALEDNPAPLVVEVKRALQLGAAPGRLVNMHHCVMRGCIQLVMAVHLTGGPEGVLIAGSNLCEDEEMKRLAWEAAEQVLGQDAAGAGMVMNDWVCPEQAAAGGGGAEGVMGYVEGGRVSLEGEGDIVVWLVGGLGAAGVGGMVRVVLVEDVGGSVLIDQDVEACGGAEGCEVVSIRVPRAALPPTAPGTVPALVHLLVMPPNDSQGRVLWSAPLLASAPPLVTRELQLLHSCTAEYLTQHNDPPLTPSSIPPTPALANARAYQQHLIPLIWDLLQCFSSTPTLLFTPPTPFPHQHALLEDLLTFLHHTQPPMSSTILWLQTSPLLSPSTPTPTAPPTPRPPAALSAVLCGSFPPSRPPLEPLFQGYLKARTYTMDRTVGALQLALLFVSALKADCWHHRLTAAAHSLAHLWLHLRVRGPAREHCSRQALMACTMAALLLHLGAFAMVFKYPANFVELWRQHPSVVVVYFGVFYLAANQAGFLCTTAAATVITLEFAVMLGPYFTAPQLAARLLGLFALPSALAFEADLLYRRAFLRADPAAWGSVGAAREGKMKAA